MLFRSLRHRVGGTWLAVTGPLMPRGEHERLAREGEAAGVAVRRVVPELRAHVALADCLVGMPGYNTVCDLLSYRPRAILVPRESRSLEQRIRAERLREWGVAQVVDAGELGGDQLVRSLELALASQRPPRAPVSLAGLDSALDVFDRRYDRVRAA